MVQQTGQPATWAKNDGDVVVTCPLCGMRHLVREGKPSEGDYKVDARGVVYPSLLCPNPHCTFDHYVLLQGWSTMGKLGRKSDNEKGVILYCMIWVKRLFTRDGTEYWKSQPPQYTHAASREAARMTWEPLITADNGRIIEIAPVIDNRITGDATEEERRVII